jgi:hypothetical protein
MIWSLFLFFFKLLISTRASSTEALQDPKECVVLRMTSSHVVFVT